MERPSGPISTTTDLEAVFAAMTDRVIAIDRDGTFLQVVRTGAPQLFENDTDVAGLNVRDIRSQIVADTVIAAVRSCLDSGGPVTAEYPLETQVGLRWVSGVFSPLTADAAVGVIRDITEMVLARQELEAARTALEQRVNERTQELATLLEISRSIGSTIELGPLLDIVIGQVKTIVNYDRCSLYFLQDDRLNLLGSHSGRLGLPAPYLLVEQIRPIWSRLERGENMVIDDIWGDTDVAIAYRAGLGDALQVAAAGVQSWLGVPLLAQERVIGFLALSHSQRAFFTEHYVRLIRAIGTQAAVSIENAHLHEQTLKMAAIEERQRLARELHDSVSQALYGISLGAQTAKTYLSEDDGATPSVDYVLTLAEAGMAEMRALLFELRPESLEVEGLVAALQKQALALSARYRLPIETTFGAEPSISLEEKEVFYRVGQEALHNIVKHARATLVHLMLTADNDAVVLEVRDNGAGFDTTQNFPGHIGMISMSERARAVGAVWQVESMPGAGTTVRLTQRYGD
jgi:signal transduction histidine kinase